MTKSRRFTIGGMLFLVGWVPAWASAEMAADEVSPRLKLTVHLDKEQFEEGEPIPVTVRLVNLANAAYLVQTSTEETGSLDGYRFQVLREDGSEVPVPRTRLSAIKAIGSWDSVAATGQHHRKIFLNYWVMPLAPGRYSVSASYVPRSVSNGHVKQWPAIMAAPVVFALEPTTAEKLEVRVDRMTRQAAEDDPLALDFLGFTGLSAAVKPLLNGVYHEQTGHQRRAANALGYLVDPTVVQQAVSRRLEQAGATPVFAEWLHQHGTPADQLVSVYLAQVTNSNPVIRAGSLTGLRLVGETADTPPAVSAWPAIRRAALAALKDRSSAVRRIAVLVLSGRIDEETQAALATLLDHESNRSVRRAVALVLARSRDQQAQSALEPASQ